jgi:hypothetical protein
MKALEALFNEVLKEIEKIDGVRLKLQSDAPCPRKRVRAQAFEGSVVCLQSWKGKRPRK